MSISMNYEDLFDYEKGIYVKGKIFDEAVAKYLQENQSHHRHDERSGETFAGEL